MIDGYAVTPGGATLAPAYTLRGPVHDGD